MLRAKCTSCMELLFIEYSFFLFRVKAQIQDIIFHFVRIGNSNKMLNQRILNLEVNIKNKESCRIRVKKLKFIKYKKCK
jgi:hypothetical protein